MRKNKCQKNNIFITIIIAIIVLVFIVGCAKNEQSDFFQAAQSAVGGAGIQASAGNVTTTPLVLKRNTGLVEIGEKMFIAQVNDVYLNAEDYLNRTIKLEGIFIQEEYYEGQNPYCYVVRYGPGCCGNDGLVGFEVKWSKDITKPYPDIDAWVEVIGVLRYYKENNVDYLYLDLSSLNELDKRGTEFVAQ